MTTLQCFCHCLFSFISCLHDFSASFMLLLVIESLLTKININISWSIFLLPTENGLINRRTFRSKIVLGFSFYVLTGSGIQSQKGMITNLQQKSSHFFCNVCKCIHQTIAGLALKWSEKYLCEQWFDVMDLFVKVTRLLTPLKQTFNWQK